MKCSGTRVGAVVVANKIDAVMMTLRKVNSEEQMNIVNLQRFLSFPFALKLVLILVLLYCLSPWFILPCTFSFLHYVPSLFHN